MDVTIILAQILGIIFVVLGLSLIFQKNNTVSVMGELIQNKGFMWMGGFLALSMGAIIIVLNNIWSSGLPLIITFLGWLALIKGIFLMLFPKTAASFYGKANKSSLFVIVGIIVLILGLVLFFYR
jgi:hypothetical protein